MKNKEIEKILKYLKNNTYIPDETKRKYKILHRDEVKLLLSYIEQLEKQLKEEQEDNYKQSEWLVKKQKKIEQLETDCKEAIESVTWWRNRFNAIERDNKNLKNNRDKAIDYIDITIELIEQQPTEDDTWILDRLKGFKNILKGDSDE